MTLYEGRYERRVFVGYDVSKRISVVLRDGTKLEDLLAALFERGANSLHGVVFRSSLSIEKRKEARLQAVRAAREKAEAMAGALGQRVGRRLSIDTVGAGGGFGGANLRNFSLDNDTQATVTETMATGKIQISASVNVVFELIDP